MMAVEERKSENGFGHLSILVLGNDASGRAFSRVSQLASWSLIPQGPL